MQNLYDYDFVNTGLIGEEAKTHGIPIDVDLDDLNDDGVTTQEERLQFRQLVIDAIKAKEPDYVETKERAYVATVLGVPDVASTLAYARTKGAQAVKEWAESVDQAIKDIRDEHHAFYKG